MGGYQYFQDLKERKIREIRQEERERIMRRLAPVLRQNGKLNAVMPALNCSNRSVFIDVDNLDVLRGLNRGIADANY